MRGVYLKGPKCVPALGMGMQRLRVAEMQPARSTAHFERYKLA
jgi:hypothetical protein